EGCTTLPQLTGAKLNGLMLGYEMGLTSGVLLQLRSLLSLSCREQELLVSSPLLGALFICLAGGPILDRYGRRCSLLLSAALVIGGTIVLIAVTSFIVLTLGRLIVGMGTSLSGTAACLYIAEISPRERRGLLVTLYELMLVVGVMLGFGCSYGFSTVSHGWAYTFGLVIPPALLQMIALVFLPPSPRFLVARGQVEKAGWVLARLRGGRKEDVDLELRDIRLDSIKNLNIASEIFSATKPTCGHGSLIGVALVFLSRRRDSPTSSPTRPLSLHSVGFNSHAASHSWPPRVGVVKVVGTIPAVDDGRPFRTKKFPVRRRLLQWDYRYEENRGLIKTKDWVSEDQRTAIEMSLSLKWASLISLLVYVAGFSISLGPMVYVVLSEIFPMGVRGRAVSVVSAVNWATNLLISMTFLTITEKIGLPNIMFIYAAMSFVLLVFVILCVPQTKGRTLEEISKELENVFRKRRC
uniref:Solute carrier family 2, facilitated glucose transporter member 12 n=1 Tax=Gouania willdenowi TaxID=441366 RepID=A0A8C5GBK5_GOUWI